MNLQTKETIKVWVDFKDGKCVCICPRNQKKCRKKCIPDVVERDKLRGWQDTFKRDRYGKSKGG